MDRTGQTHYVKMPGVVSSRSLSHCFHMSMSSQWRLPRSVPSHASNRPTEVPGLSVWQPPHPWTASLSTPLLSAHLLSAFSYHLKGEKAAGIEPRCCACKQNLHFFCTDCFQSGCCCLLQSKGPLGLDAGFPGVLLHWLPSALTH